MVTNCARQESIWISQIFFLQAKVTKEIQAILIENLGIMHNSMPPSKTVWSSLNVVIFPPVLLLVLGDSKQ